MADEEKASGALASIEDWEDIPKKLLEAIFEGLAKEPSKWIVMGLGFYLGYKGIDVLKWFGLGLNNFLKSEPVDTVVNATMDLAAMQILPFKPVETILGLITEGGGRGASGDGLRNRNRGRPCGEDIIGPR